MESVLLCLLVLVLLVLWVSGLVKYVLFFFAAWFELSCKQESVVTDAEESTGDQKFRFLSSV